MPKCHDLAIAFMQARCALLREGSQAPDQQVKFTDMVEWVGDNSVSVPSKAEAVKVVEIAELSRDGCTPAEIKTFLKSKAYNTQAYSMGASLYGEELEGSRAWQLLQMALEANPQRFNASFGVCSFVIKGKPSRRTRRTSRFETLLATPFEKMMFMIQVGRALAVNYKSGSSKSRRILKSLKMRREHGQRIGYVVQVVIRAWDVIARSFRFQDCQELFSPYIIFNHDTFEFDVIEDPSIGFAQLKQSKSLTGNTEATNDQEECCPEAFKRRLETRELDQNLRTLAKDFICDMNRLVLCDNLYFMQDDEPWDELDRFVETADRSKTPIRFQDYSVELLASIREQMPSRPLPKPVPSASRSVAVQGARRRNSKHTPREVAPARRSSIPLPSDEIQAIGPSRASSRVASPSPAADFASNAPERDVSRRFSKCPETCECSAARKALENAMQPFARTYCCTFGDLVSLDDVGGDYEEIAGDVQLVLCDPPYNYRRKKNLRNSSHDLLTEEQIEECVDVIDSLLREGGHAIIFCAALQFHLWHKHFSSRTFDSSRSSEEQDEEGNSSGSCEPVFLVDPSPLILIDKPGHYYGNAFKKKTQLHRVSEFAIHVTKAGLIPEEAFKLVNYENHNHVSSDQPGWTNVINFVARLEKGERVRVQDPKKQGRTMALRPEQKSRALLKEIICRFTYPGDYVVDMFAGSFSTGTASISLPEYRRFVGCDLDQKAFDLGTEQLVLAFAEQILNSISNIDLPEMETAARILLQHNPLYQEGDSDPHWAPPRGFPYFQSVPFHIIRFLACRWELPCLEIDCLDKPVSSWPSKYVGRLQTMDLKELAAHEGSNMGLAVARSTIAHPEAGNGLFAMRPFRKNERIGYYYGTLVYRDLRRSKETTKSYGEQGVLGATLKSFGKYSVPVPVVGEQLTGKIDGTSHAYVVGAEFCVCRYINDPFYRQGDKEKEAVDRGFKDRRKANVFIERSQEQIASLTTLSKYQAICIKAKRDIEPGEELFCASI